LRLRRHSLVENEIVIIAATEGDLRVMAVTQPVGDPSAVSKIECGALNRLNLAGRNELAVDRCEG